MIYSRIKRQFFLIIVSIILFTFNTNAEEPLQMVKQWGSPGMVSFLVQSEDGSLFATINSGDYSKIKVWKATGSLYRLIDAGKVISGQGNVIAFSPDNKKIAVASDEEITIWNLKNLSKYSIGMNSTNYFRRMFKTVLFLDNERLVVGSYAIITRNTPKTIPYADFENKIIANLIDLQDRALVLNSYKLDLEHKQYIIKDNLTDNEITELMNIFRKKTKYEISSSYQTKNIIETWTIHGEKLKKIGELNGKQNDLLYQIVMDPDKTQILASTFYGEMKLWNLIDGSVINIKGDMMPYGLKFSNDGTLFGWASSAGLRICNTTGLFVVNINRTLGISYLDIDNRVLLESSAIGSNTKAMKPVIKEWDFKGNLKKTYEGVETYIMKLLLSPDKKRIILGVQDGSVAILNRNTGDLVSMINEGDDWLAYTGDGYWSASRNGGRLVSMVQDLTIFGIDQFAFMNNRPDIIIERLGINNPGLEAHYYHLFKKRLQKLGIEEKDLTRELYVPVVKITKKEKKDKFITISFRMFDKKYPLKQYNIYVNDVPLFGAYGKKISGKEVSLTERIELTSGNNKIEITCFNEKGAESLRVMTMATYNKKVKSDLYFIGFGVSEYADPEIADLKFAHQDVLDLGEMLKKCKRRYNNIYTYTYINKDVTINAIKNAKSLLKNAKVDDTLVLFIAGHGVHDTDAEATYYFITHNTKLKNLSGTAANFEFLEDILQGIPPRNKLFLMDTCDSGEVDDEESSGYFKMADSRGLKARTIKPIDSNVKKKKKIVKRNVRTYLREIDRYIYNDLIRRSGAIVFSSSKGGEFSYESAAYQNGLFTETIINALTSDTADKDGNGFVSTDELRAFVMNEVPKMTDNGQHPTVDRDNIYQKFGIPTVKVTKE